jgi:hypothetical protein
VDQQLQQLKRQAALDGDYVAYDAALERTGQKRIVMRQLTLGVFRQLLDHIVTTNWSHTDRFAANGTGTTFQVELENLKPGYVIYVKYLNLYYRVFHIAIKEFIIPVEFLQKPE